MSLSSLLLAGKGSGLTSFFSLQYLLIFLPACLIGYSLIPKKGKRFFLLIASYLFFWLISGKLLAYLLLSTVSIHYFGLWLDRSQEKMRSALSELPKEERAAIKKKFVTSQRWIIFLAVCLHIGMLLVLKYSGFFATNINTVLSHFGATRQLEVPTYLMPIGISFFSLQALSYILDVHNRTIKADDNLFRLALFLGFFPQIVEGPICRYQQTADALWNVGPIKYENLTLGLQRILYGMMKKIVVADRLNPLVKEVFANYGDYDGGVIALAAVCYTIQLYMDFSGSMDAVIGTAQIFGVKVPENFQRPFFSKNISEFWTRWHITLGTWFKDYIFYPISTAKPMKKLVSKTRKTLGVYYASLLSGSVALFAVWFCNGLWHGSAWNYIFFGLYHFALILTGKLIAPLVMKTNAAFHIQAESRPYRLMQIIRTAGLVVIGELFFRAEGLRAGLTMFRKMVTEFSLASFNTELLTKLNVDSYDMGIVAITVFIVFIVSLITEKGINVREHLAFRSFVLRWGVFYAMILFIVVFGAYGYGYVAVDPMYAQF